MSDIHGMIGPLRQRLEQLDMDELRSGREYKPYRYYYLEQHNKYIIFLVLPYVWGNLFEHYPSSLCILFG